MIDDLAPDGELEGVDAPEIEEEGVEIASPRTIEDYAREKGWRPKEEFAGEEGDWRDAETFVNFGLDKSQSLSKDLKGLKETVSNMARTHTALTEQAVESARVKEREKWKDIHSRAVDEGDQEVAEQAVGELTKLSAPDAPQQDSSHIEQFQKDNPWFGTDPIAKAVAIQTAQIYADDGKTPAEQLEAAKKAVLQRFPEYAPEKPKAPDVAKPAGGAAPARKGKSFHDLPADAQQAAKLMASKGYGTVEGYVKQYFNKEGLVE